MGGAKFRGTGAAKQPNDPCVEQESLKETATKAVFFEVTLGPSAEACVGGRNQWKKK